MFHRLSWGGIRGKGIRLRSDVALSLTALIMATLVVILAYFVFERSAVMIYVEQTRAPVDIANKVVGQVDKLWDSDLLTKSSDPLTNETDPDAMRLEAEFWHRQLGIDDKKIRSAKTDFDKHQTSPNATQKLEMEIGSYLRAAGSYETNARAMVEYLHDLTLREMSMHDAIYGVSYSQGFINPAVLRQRDAVLETELNAVAQLTPPSSLKVFHEDTIRFLGDYVTIQKQTTAAYESGAGLERLEALGEQGELVIREGRAKLKADIRTIKTGQLGRDSQRARARKKSARDEEERLRLLYKF